MDKNFMKSMGWSLTVHATLVAILLFNGFKIPGGGEGQFPEGGQAQADQQAGAAEHEPIQVEIIDPPKKEAEVAETKPTEEDGLLEKAPHANDVCPSFFGGIGITQQYTASASDPARGAIYVAIVHRGYPAERAGIQVGDELLNSRDIRGDIGTTVVVQVVRNGQYLSFEIVRDKICTEAIDEGEEP